MESKLKVYEVEYASGLFRCSNLQTTEIYCEKELEIGDFIVVEHIDLSDYFEKITREEKKKVLETKMKDAFKVLDEKKKYEYYAT